jgi:hypothetical protein
LLKLEKCGVSHSFPSSLKVYENKSKSNNRKWIF